MVLRFPRLFFFLFGFKEVQNQGYGRMYELSVRVPALSNIDRKMVSVMTPTVCGVVFYYREKGYKFMMIEKLHSGSKNRYKYDLPKGRLKAGETEMECVFREVKEELSNAPRFSLENQEMCVFTHYDRDYQSEVKFVFYYVEVKETVSFRSKKGAKLIWVYEPVKDVRPFLTLVSKRLHEKAIDDDKGRQDRTEVLKFIKGRKLLSSDEIHKCFGGIHKSTLDAYLQHFVVRGEITRKNTEYSIMYYFNTGGGNIKPIKGVDNK